MRIKKENIVERRARVNKVFDKKELRESNKKCTIIRRSFAQYTEQSTRHIAYTYLHIVPSMYTRAYTHARIHSTIFFCSHRNRLFGRLEGRMCGVLLWHKMCHNCGREIHVYVSYRFGCVLFATEFCCRRRRRRRRHRCMYIFVQ